MIVRQARLLSSERAACFVLGFGGVELLQQSLSLGARGDVSEARCRERGESAFEEEANAFLFPFDYALLDTCLDALLQNLVPERRLCRYSAVSTLPNLPSS